MRLRVLTATLAIVVPALLSAQRGVVTGVVHDSLTGRPLAGTIVTLAGNGYGQATPSEQNGSFRFTKAFPASYTLSARRLGYAPVSLTIHVDEEAKPFVIAMTPLPGLDTVRVRPGTGIFGEVGTLRTLRPIRGADIQVIGVGTRLTTDDRGRFFLPLKAPGAYVVRAKVPGYEAQTVSVVVTRDETVDVMMLLDSTTTKSSNAYEMAWGQFSDRARLRGSRSGLVSRSELLDHGDMSLIQALERVPSIAEKHLRFGPTVCLFVEGRPVAATPINSIDIEAIEAVEVYTAETRSDETNTLARASRGYECHSTGLPDTFAPESDLIKWVVVWLKH